MQTEQMHIKAVFEVRSVGGEQSGSGRGWRRDDCVCCCGVASLLEATGADYAVIVLRITRHLVLTGVD